MSFGYSVGDFIATGELALRVYREYRDAPAQFAAISTEVGSLHLVLKDVDSTVRERDLSPEREADLIQICQGCRSVLTDLDALLQRYKNMGKTTRWSWDRLKWHQSDITEMRSRVISNTGMLNAFNLSLTSSVTSQIEKQLIQLRLEIQSGKRESSVITVSSMEAAQGGDESIWREIKRELEDAGITEEMVNEHRGFIATWVINAINSGQLEEKAVRNVPQGESETLCNNAEDHEAESPEDEAKEDSYPGSDVESERALPDEVDSEDGSDEFLKAAAQKIAEFQRLGREAIEASDYDEARDHLQKAKDLAVLLFGVQSRKAQDCCTLLEESFAHRPLPSHQSSQQETAAIFRMSDQSTDKFSYTLDLARSPSITSHPQRQVSMSGSVTANSSITPQKSFQTLGSQPPMPPSIYEVTGGFDMIGALMKVATRPNLEIDLGKIDLSCAFVVCDITQYDCPIIYVSDNFERLTGYNKYEIKGQNCRFLQSPDGKVEAGAERKFSNSNAAYYLKNKIDQRKDAQCSIINYRKGGQPFMNLLTIIPITGEDDKSIKYYVGFQVDVLVKPTALEAKNFGGHYTIDYS